MFYWKQEKWKHYTEYWAYQKRRTNLFYPIVSFTCFALLSPQNAQTNHGLIKVKEKKNKTKPKSPKTNKTTNPPLKKHPKSYDWDYIALIFKFL